MKITKEIINKLENTKYNHEDLIPDEAPVLVKFFNPTGIGTWYALEGEKVKDDWVFFGVADLGFPEYGEFVLSELESIKAPPFGLGIERAAMIKYGIENIRDFYANDYQFLKQFK